MILKGVIILFLKSIKRLIYVT